MFVFEWTEGERKNSSARADSRRRMLLQSVPTVPVAALRAVPDCGFPAQISARPFSVAPNDEQSGSSVPLKTS
jgi:hypothetical protein